jgi:hypothetical protein
MCESVRKYKIRIFSNKEGLTLEDVIEAPTLSEAMATAQAMDNDINAKHMYAADFRVKAITIEEA